MALESLFNKLLEHPWEMLIHLQQAHWALRPWGRDSDPPPISYYMLLHGFSLKEIVQQMREQEGLIFNGSEVKVFQDLSPITLQNRSAETVEECLGTPYRLQMI